ncbi:TlpA disulfide reductase family protein [Mucilaginibacter sabulilitoris]|uniref:TlpA disulfide reductase family protein n=1 Tax=Mucilaginibacter sabulilitoris TaxID=1173583 RepID=A0ABZ0TU93_9SPHI|nr:TlpA disulfide reductase family protein [Mucilaginibacter sabulilitoris]WPU94735.1 TlpA disulfide reductase family protein [Mucilaginibacter sabulilitoris]
MMKKIMLFLGGLPAVALAQVKPNYEIHGKLNGVEAKQVFVIHDEGAFKRITDSAVVVNHEYDLKGYVEVGQHTYMFTYNMKNVKPLKADGIVQMFLSPGEYTVTHNNSFRDVVVTGSKGYDDYQSLRTAAKPYEDQVNRLKTEAYQFAKQKDTVGLNSTNAKLYALEHEYKPKVYGNFIKQHPQSPAAFYALKELAGIAHQIDGQALKPYFDLLPKQVKQSTDGKEFGKRIDDAITFDTKGAIGSVAPDFTLLDTAGRRVKLSDYRGKYVLLDFWASWCAPCRADNPHLVAAYRQYHAKGFNILSVSLDTKAREKAWFTAIDHDHLTAWTHVADLQHDSNEVLGIYGISGIPQNFLIGPDGRIIGRSLRGGDLEKKLQEILK